MTDDHHHDRPPTLGQWLTYYFDFVLYPAVVVACIVFDWRTVAAHPSAWGVLMVVGFVVWTFAEYWIHRAVLHGPYWMGIHERHHTHPREMTAFPFWQIPMYFATIFALTWFVCGQWTPPVFAGIIVGWIGFFLMHHLMHQMTPRQLAEWPYLEAFARRHNLHHKVTDANYGITVDIWDRVFRTYREIRR